MGVPKKKSSKSARNQRRSHHKLEPKNLAKCKNCDQPVKPHVVCKNCGHYRGKKVK